MKGEGIAEALHSFYPQLWAQKTKTSIIYNMHIGGKKFAAITFEDL